MSLFKPINRYGDTVNSYDAIKFVALLLMVIDHIGAYFLPEVTELRMIGRMSAPIWLILVGYSDARNVPTSFIIGAALIIGAGLISGGPIFPTNILVSVIVIKLIIDKLTHTYFKTYSSLFELFFILTLLSLPLSVLFDYGGCAILFAVYGFMLKNKDFKVNSTKVRIIFGIGLTIIHSITQGFIFQFSAVQTLSVFFGISAVVITMSVFKPYEFKSFNQFSPKIITTPIRICGRYNLEFYVIHIILFKILSTFLQTGETRWFEFTLFPWN